jgi:cation:H+ antiporter
MATGARRSLMTAGVERHHRSWVAILAMAALGVPAVVMRLAGTHPDPVVGAFVFGIAVLAAAFILSWAAEAAELEISQGFALAIIALIAVLPEYAVDAVLAWQAGADPVEAEKGLAIANMTGGNRLLIGLAWPIVFFIFVYRTKLKELVVDSQRSLEIAFLTIATLYVILIPLRNHVTIIDTMVLVTMFVAYVICTARQESHEIELVGPARAIGALQRGRRRVLTLMMLAGAAFVIFAAAHPFTEALKEIGADFGISEFLLIQWLAPLASEAPEVLVAALLAWRGRAAAGMGVLISSKVNQWTLLIGTLPVVYLISAGEFGFTTGLPLDSHQREEIFLTAAQSAFAIAVFINLRMARREALALLILFATQLFITNESVRLWYSAAYAVLCVIILIINRKDIPVTARMAWRTIRGAPAAESH